MNATPQSTLSISTPKVFSLEVVFPALFLIGFIIFPLVDLNVATFLCYLALLIFHMHVCIALTFDGFTRFSRYGLSHKHPILDKVISSAMIFGCFAGLSFIVLFMNAYSLLVSHDKPDEQKSLPIYDRDFIVPFIQAVILTTALIILIMGY